MGGRRSECISDRRSGLIGANWPTTGKPLCDGVLPWPATSFDQCVTMMKTIISFNIRCYSGKTTIRYYTNETGLHKIDYINVSTRSRVLIIIRNIKIRYNSVVFLIVENQTNTKTSHNKTQGIVIVTICDSRYNCIRFFNI